MDKWELILRTGEGKEYIAVYDMLNFDLTKGSDRVEIIESVEEVLKQALLEAVQS